jgi:hypothetical protein
VHLKIKARTVEIKPSQKPIAESCFSIPISLIKIIEVWPEFARTLHRARKGVKQRLSMDGGCGLIRQLETPTHAGR